jgi:hypothetical protein
MKQVLISISFLFITQTSFSWGFYGHRQINYYAVFLLPPEMLIFYKKHIAFISEHAVDPDKRRYDCRLKDPDIDIDRYGSYPYDSPATMEGCR